MFDQCLVDDDFQGEVEDDCLKNPGNCEDGLSLSLFYKNTFTYVMFIRYEH